MIFPAFFGHMTRVPALWRSNPHTGPFQALNPSLGRLCVWRELKAVNLLWSNPHKVPVVFNQCPPQAMTLDSVWTSPNEAFAFDHNTIRLCHHAWTVDYVTNNHQSRIDYAGSAQRHLVGVGKITHTVSIVTPQLRCDTDSWFHIFWLNVGCTVEVLERISNLLSM